MQATKKQIKTPSQKAITAELFLCVGIHDMRPHAHGHQWPAPLQAFAARNVRQDNAARHKTRAHLVENDLLWRPLVPGSRLNLVWVGKQVALA